MTGRHSETKEIQDRGENRPGLVCGVMNVQQYELQVGEGGERLDRFVADKLPKVSRSMAQMLIEKQQIVVNGEPAKASYRVKVGDLVVAVLPAQTASIPLPEPIPLNMVYEDSDLLVVDKPPGLVVHPAPGHSGGTLVNALLACCPELAGSGGDRPGIVHRLDRDTSGLILVAKNEKTRRGLQEQFKERLVHKVYLALLDDHLRPGWGRIEAPLGRDPLHRQRMAVLPGGRDAITEYHVLERFSQETGQAAGDYSLVEAELKTGRTHQIRVHFASIGHPVVGDTVYGHRRLRLAVPRQFLHASKLGLRHPTTGVRLALEAPFPQDLKPVLELLRSESIRA